jgi:hypothetical protein
MITEIKDALLIPEIMLLAAKIPSRLPLTTLEKLLYRDINSALARVYAVKEEGVYKGFVFITIEEFDGENALLINAAYMNPKLDKAITRELWAKIKQWGRDLGFRYVYCLTQRKPFGFMRKYKFEFDSYLLKTSTEED